MHPSNMPTDWRALCEELFTDYEQHLYRSVLADRTRAALAQPEPEVVGPTDEELADTYWDAWHKHLDRTNSVLHSVGLRAVLARWGNYPAKPDSSIDGLAVPNGREPASVVGEPSDQELTQEWQRLMGAPEAILAQPMLAFARAVLARWGRPAPASAGDLIQAYQAGRKDAEADAQQAAEVAEDRPTGEVTELVAWIRQEGVHSECGHELLRAADLLERQAAQVPVAVAVSERLPQPEDCDAEGMCWWWYPPVPEQNYGYWIYEDNAVPERSRLEWPESWLPAHALPLPSREVG